MRSNLVKQCIAYTSGIDKRFAKAAPLNFNDTSYKPSEVRQTFQDLVDLALEANTTRTRWLVLAAKVRETAAQVRPFAKAFKTFLLGLYGKNKEALGDFGVAPARVVKPKVAVKAEAQKKGEATRVLRHTMGPKARKRIKVTTTVKA